MLVLVLVGVTAPEGGYESKYSLEAGVRIGLCIGDVKVDAVESLSLRNQFVVVLRFEVMMLFGSFATMAAFSFALVIPDLHLPLSKCCICADGHLNFLLQSFPARHLMLLRGLCRTDFKCLLMSDSVWKVL